VDAPAKVILVKFFFKDFGKLKMGFWVLFDFFFFGKEFFKGRNCKKKRAQFCGGGFLFFFLGKMALEGRKKKKNFLK